MLVGGPIFKPSKPGGPSSSEYDVIVIGTAGPLKGVIKGGWEIPSKMKVYSWENQLYMGKFHGFSIAMFDYRRINDLT